MNTLKDYYKELSTSQPNPSLNIEYMPSKAKQLSLRRCITITAVIVMSLSLATVTYAAVRHFVDRAAVGVSDTFVAVPNESQVELYPEDFSYLPVADGVACNEHEGMTCSEHVGIFCAGSYEEAAALLGREFRLPDIDGYVVNLYEMQHKTYLEKDHSFYSVTVVMHHIESSPMDSNHLLIIRVTRDDTSFVPDNPFDIQVTGPIEELYINGVKVYAITDNGQMIRYIWEYDGITYEIFARDGISHTEYLRIIESMTQ
jgi:hypothetical protein